MQKLLDKENTTRTSADPGVTDTSGNQGLLQKSAQTDEATQHLVCIFRLLLFTIDPIHLILVTHRATPKLFWK